MTAPAAPEPIPGKDAQDYFTDLRIWVTDHLHAGHSVRQCCYRMSLTAIVHRLIKYGPDETLNNLTARDLMNLLIYTNGEIAEWLMRSAFTRALIDDDRLVYEHLANLPFMSECTGWYWKLVNGIVGASPDPSADTAWLQSLPPEEKALAHLLVARVFPDTAHLSWLDDVPEHCPRIAYHLAQIIATKQHHKNAVENWLRAHPHVKNQAYN